MNFSEKVLFVRGKMNLTQVNLAKELGVAFVTINRWENGRAEPNKLPKLRFYEFCKKNDIFFDNQTSGSNNNEKNKR